jgi:hypothetical protein
MMKVSEKEIDSALQQFKIAEHGDRSEQLLWPFVAAEFPNYENLWRKYIVPLTQRLDTTASRKAANSSAVRVQGFRAVRYGALLHFLFLRPLDAETAISRGR